MDHDQSKKVTGATISLSKDAVLDAEEIIREAFAIGAAGTDVQHTATGILTKLLVALDAEYITED